MKKIKPKEDPTGFPYSKAVNEGNINLNTYMLSPREKKAMKINKSESVTFDPFIDHVYITKTGEVLATVEDLQKNGREISEHYARDMKLQKRALEKKIIEESQEIRSFNARTLLAEKKLVQGWIQYNKSLSKKISDQSRYQSKKNKELGDYVERTVVGMNKYNLSYRKTIYTILSDMRRYDSKIKWRDRIIFGLVVILVLHFPSVWWSIAGLLLIVLVSRFI